MLLLNSSEGVLPSSCPAVKPFTCRINFCFKIGEGDNVIHFQPSSSPADVSCYLTFLSVSRYYTEWEIYVPTVLKSRCCTRQMSGAKISGSRKRGSRRISRFKNGPFVKARREGPPVPNRLILTGLRHVTCHTWKWRWVQMRLEEAGGGQVENMGETSLSFALNNPRILPTWHQICSSLFNIFYA